MIAFRIFRLIISCLVVLSLAGCGVEGYETTKGNQIQSVVSPTISTTQTPTLIPTATDQATPTPTWVTLERNFILTVNVDPYLECKSEQGNETWLYDPSVADQPLQKLMGGQNLPYSRVSPNGVRLAQIQTEETTSRTVVVDQPIILTDTLVIKEMNDPKKEITLGPFERQEIYGLMGTNVACFTIVGISFPPIWSPDSQNVLLVQTKVDLDGKKVHYSYLLVNIVTKEIKNILTQTGGSLPVWNEKGDRIYIPSPGSRSIEILEFQSGNVKPFGRIDFPEKISSDAIFHFSSSVVGSGFYGYFQLASPSNSETNSRLWKYDIQNDVWEEIVLKYSDFSWIYTSTSIHILCSSHNITVFSNITGGEIGFSSFPSDILVDCGIGQLEHDQKDIYHFYVLTSGSSSKDNGIYELQIDGTSIVKKLILNQATVNEITGKSLADLSVSK